MSSKWSPDAETAKERNEPLHALRSAEALLLAGAARYAGRQVLAPVVMRWPYHAALHCGCFR